MNRVKFNVNTEYAYLQNFKILQSKAKTSSRSSLSPLEISWTNAFYSLDAFTKHGIERQVPVEALIKCKMQDNLEFLQWSKRYWDQYYPGGDYDALSRRKGSGAPGTASTPAPTSARTSGAGAARRGTTPTTASATRRTPAAGGASAVLQSENTQLKQTVEGLERERDFYFSKLRDIELLVQQAVDQDPEVEKDENGLVKLIQAILYSTEEGFEIPAEAEGVVGEEETF